MDIWTVALVARIACAYIIGKPTVISLNRYAMNRNQLYSRGNDIDGERVKEPFQLMELPYGMGDLAPQISEETIRFHYLKHHAGYVKRLNELAKHDPSIAHMSLDELVKSSHGVVYNMAAQIWNHDFYWMGLSPASCLDDAPITKGLIDKTFGSLDELKRQYYKMAIGHFGSGWVWLLYDRVTDSFKLTATKDADNPVRTLMAHPVLVVDVWEHAYYIDYRNDKAKYTEAWFEKINWKRVEDLIEKYKNL